VVHGRLLAAAHVTFMEFCLLAATMMSCSSRVQGGPAAGLLLMLVWAPWLSPGG
jgi:hypothetical protein